MLASGESHIAVALDDATDLDLHLDLPCGNFVDDSNDFPVVKVNHIIGLQESLDNVTANSELGVVRPLGELVDNHGDGGATSDPAGPILKVGDTNLSSPGLEHESASLVWSEPLGVLIPVDELDILFHAPMAQVKTSHRHASVDQLHHLVNLTGGWSINTWFELKE
jgi:hypothetical protein